MSGATTHAEVTIGYASARRRSPQRMSGDPLVTLNPPAFPFAVQERFFARLLHNTDAATREAFFRTMEVIGKNLDEILKENG